MQSWDRFNEISRLQRIKEKFDMEKDVQYERMHQRFSSPQERKRVLVALIGTANVKERQQCTVSNRNWKSNENRKSQNKQVSRKKRSSSPKRMPKRRQETRTIVRVVPLRSYPSSHISSYQPKSDVEAQKKETKWERLELLQNSMFYMDDGGGESGEPSSASFKEVKYVRMSALSPKSYARQHLSNTFGHYETDTFFSHDRTPRLPSISESEERDLNESPDPETDRTVDDIPEVVHYTDGYRVGSIQVFEPVFVLNSLSRPATRSSSAFTPRSVSLSVNSTPQRRVSTSSITSHSSSSNK